MRRLGRQGASASHVMPPQDAAWLGLEHPTNLMVVTAVLLLDGRPDVEALRALVQHRMVDRYPSFHRRVIGTEGFWSRARWQDDPDFDLAAHFRTTNLTGPISTHLEPFIANLMGRALPPNRSPWSMHLINDPVGCSALVVRVHHCVADGIALAAVLLSLTDSQNPDDNGAAARSGVNRPKATAATLLITSCRVVSALLRILQMSHEPPSRLRTALGTRKRVGLGKGVDLAVVKAQAGGASVNDAVLAAVAGGLRRELVCGGEDPKDLRVLVPVDLRPRGAAVPASLGNRFGMIVLRLPVAAAEAHQRLAQVQLRTSRAKSSVEAVATFAGLTVLGFMPRVIQSLAVRVLGSRVTAVVTNVPGPRHPVLLAGHRVARIAFWVPQTGDVGVGISVFSYAGRVSVGVALDAGLNVDPSALAQAIEAELCGR